MRATKSTTDKVTHPSELCAARPPTIVRWAIASAVCSLSVHPTDELACSRCCRCSDLLHLGIARHVAGIARRSLEPELVALGASLRPTVSAARALVGGARSAPPRGLVAPISAFAVPPPLWRRGRDRYHRHTPVG